MAYAEAHSGNTVLAPVYGWFTEGFDTADLQEARALLDTLAAESAKFEAEQPTKSTD